MPSYMDCYALGVDASALGYSASRDCDWYDWLRATDRDIWRAVGGDHCAWVFFMAGLRGIAIPQPVIGWRWGRIPAAGRSYNARDDRPEDGVSVMEAYTTHWMPLGETADGVSALFISAGRPIVWVRGYLHPYRRGADGEPLLVGAEEL